MKLHTIFIFSFMMLLAPVVKGQSEKVEDGYTKFYYPNGQISSEGYMKDGKPDGYWITYYVSGVKKSEGNRNNFRLDSTWNFYNNIGDIVEKIDYKNGVRSGYHLKFIYKKDDPLKKPILISKELFINDLKEGLSYYYDENGKVKEVAMYSEGQRNGLAKEFDEDSTIITLKRYRKGYLTERERINRFNDEGQKDGVWKTFFEDGKVATEVDYKDGLMHGLYKEFNKKGTLITSLRYSEGELVASEEEEENPIVIREMRNESGKLVSQGPYQDNTPVGTHRFYDDEGNIIDGKIYNDRGILLAEGIVDAEGKRQGDWKDYYASGKVKAVGLYNDNRKTGNWKYFFENGSIEQTGNYINGKLSGVWTWYFENGMLWREEEYLNGRLEGLYTEYNENGDVIARGEYFDGEKEGEWFYDVGDHREEGKFVTGLRDGTWKYFYENGNLNFEGDYVQGNPDGKHKLYYPDESLKEERFYVMGFKEKNWKKYDDEGNLLLTVTYDDDKEIRINGVKIEFDTDDPTLIR